MQIAYTILAFCFVLSGCVAATSGSTITTGVSEQIPTTLLKPDGTGPFPAVVIMHDCSGLGPRSSGSPLRWARELVDSGYVILMPDSFSTRGHAGGVCTNASPSRNDVAPARRVADAYAALAHLRTLPYVDKARIGLMGGSHGGATTLAAMAAPEKEREPLAREKRSGFRAAISLYPNCAARMGSWRAVRPAGTTGPNFQYTGVYEPVAPLLILIGEIDDWTPAEPCRKLTESAREAEYPVSIKVYPGAHHGFDSNNPINFNPARVNGNSPSGRGATTGGDRKAWDDSVREVIAFFAHHVKKTDAPR
jgi:dienelactone hydrolase